MASPFPVGDFHLLFFASFPGAHRFRSFASFSPQVGYFQSTPESHLQVAVPDEPSGQARSSLGMGHLLTHELRES